ncbi:MAG: NAD(P)/FAD-dependent oxidoreductase [Myxococcales bacterium]|nr:NAD(P)/FAD-dependent oxidoreductase [Myxococcales bacterium]
MIEVDLAIVGAGPAGLSTALFLAAAAPSLRTRTVVLEGARFPRDKVCAGAIGARADAALARIGVKVEVPSAHVRGIAVTTSAGRRSFWVDEPAGRVVRRIEFDAELARLARARGIRIEEGAWVRSIDHQNGRLVISIEGGERLKAKALVGADGIRSVVRRALGLGRGDVVAQVAELDTTSAPGDTPEGVLHFDLRDRSLRGYAWDFPTPLGGRIEVCRGVYAVREANDAKDAGALAKERIPTGARVLGPTKRLAERGFVVGAPVSAPGAILVGEAAGIDPVLGEGIAQAILGGEVAARYLAPRLASGEIGFADWAGALAATSVGRDLARRTACMPYVYGSGRDLLERYVVTNGAIARAGLRYFGGTLSRERLLDTIRARGLRW